MELTLRAIRYMIWLNVLMVAFALGIAVGFNEQSGINVALLMALGIPILMAFRAGLVREKVWVAVLFVLYCLFDLLSALGDGLSLSNALILVDAILSFVAICGIVIWSRERSIAKAQHGT